MEGLRLNKNKFDNYVLWIVTQWGIYDDLHFRQDEVPTPFAFLVRACLDSYFPACWIGRWGPTDWPQCDFVFQEWVKEECYWPKRKYTWWTEKKIRDTLRSFFLTFEGKSRDNVLQVRKYLGLCWRVALTGSDWDLKLCNFCSLAN